MVQLAEPDISRALSPEDFKQDKPRPQTRISAGISSDLIDGVTLTPLAVNTDGRGSLIELLTSRDQMIEPIVHVYQVIAGADSIRAWVYHRWQYDRLAFANGKLRIALYDIREESPTRGKLNVFVLGSEKPSLLRIPPLVVHGVQNMSSLPTTFVNMPTAAYDPKNPDKFRIPADDPRVPFRFDD